jgi:two-component system LytT family response regulator
MITSIAIDDEPNALGVIRQYARDVPDLDLQETFTDPVKAEEWLRCNDKVSLVFLDIEMARMNGLEFIKRNPITAVHVILTTAYTDYALKGFEMDVTDYLLKPFTRDRFQSAIEKLRKRQSPPIAGVNVLVRDREEFIFVRTEQSIMKVPIGDILYIEGTGNYVSIQFPTGRILTLQNMRSLEQSIKDLGFFRIHRSYIVSMRHVKSVSRKIVNIAGLELPIGDSYRESFMDHIGSRYRLI